MAMLIAPSAPKGSPLSFHAEAEVGVLGSPQERFARGQGKGALTWSFEGNGLVRALALVLTLSPSFVEVRERWEPGTEACPSTRASSASQARLSVTVMGEP